jgi:GNAT superfamily N-acetyltransferase
MPAAATTLRLAAAADAAAAADLWLRARAAAADDGSIPPPVHGAEDVRAWFASHVVPRTSLWLAELYDGALAGLLVLNDGWVEQLYVDPQQTGKGVGSTLLARASRECEDGLQVWTFASNSGALRFYERHGFTEVRRTDGRDNEERAPDVLLRREGR